MVGQPASSQFSQSLQKSCTLRNSRPARYTWLSSVTARAGWILLGRRLALRWNVRGSPGLRLSGALGEQGGEERYRPTGETPGDSGTARQRRGHRQDTWLTIEYEGCPLPFTPERVMSLQGQVAWENRNHDRTQ